MLAIVTCEQKKWIPALLRKTILFCRVKKLGLFYQINQPNNG